MRNKERRKRRRRGERENLVGGVVRRRCRIIRFSQNYLYFNPLAAISKKDLDILTEEAEKSGNFRPAVDKAIFEAAQNPGERERYIKVIQNLASKTIHATEQEKEKVEKEGLTDRAASLGRRIEIRIYERKKRRHNNVASKFYNEKLVELGENVRREAREKREKKLKGKKRE
jgi:hypothetical protein